MARRKPAHIEGQADLFIGVKSGEFVDPTIRTWQEVEANPLLKMPFLRGSVDAPTIDVQARAHLLRSAAVNQGKANQRQGFGDAVEIEPHSTEIWGRYKASTKHRVRKAQENIPVFEAQAKKDFWEATGLTAMIAAKMISKTEAQALARVWYRGFIRKSYGGKTGEEGRKAKSQFVGGFSKQITTQKRLKKSGNQSKAA